MVTYRYTCKDCGGETEVSHSIKEEPEVHCAACGGRMQRGIDGGRAALFTDRCAAKQLHASLHKDWEDMSHARGLSQWIHKDAQPRARASLNRGIEALAEARKEGRDPQDPSTVDYLRQKRQQSESKKGTSEESD